MGLVRIGVSISRNPIARHESRGRLHESVPQDEVVLQLRAPQVENAMAQAQFLGGQLLALAARHGNRGSHRRSDHADGSAAHLDVAGGELRVLPVLRASDDLALDEHHRFRRKALGDGHRFSARVARIERDLDDSRPVSKVDKHEATKISAAMHPSAKTDRLPDMLQPQGATLVCAQTCRQSDLPRSLVSSRGLLVAALLRC